MKKIDLTKGKVLEVLIFLAIPIMGSSFFQFAYNIIDMMWVGKLGSDAVASIGSASFYVGLGNSIISLVVIGTGIKVSHSFGEKKDKEVKGYISSGIILNLFIGLIYGFILIIFGKEFIGFLNLGNSIVEKQAYSYLLISIPTLFFTFYNSLFIRIFNSFGNNKSALTINIIGILINIVLDPIFIYTLNLGVDGAAYASLIGTFVVFILLFINGRSILKVDLKEKIDFRKIKEIAILGIPMSFQRVLFTLVNIILARIIGGFGSDAIAAQKIGLQIESIVYMVIGGLNGAISSFVGQNFGAKKYKRINEGYKKALIIGGFYALFITLTFMLIPESLIKLFVREEETIKIASDYLRIIGISQMFSTIEIILNGVFTGVGRPKIPAFISIFYTVLRIPMAIILIRYLGVKGIWYAISISSILKGITAYMVYRLKVWRDYNNVRDN